MSAATVPADSGTDVAPPKRERLPDIRQSITHKFQIDGHEGYITVGLYPDGRPGELFIKMAKQGSTVSGLMDTIGILTSLALQYGVEVHALAGKLAHMRFEPAGWTGNEDIRRAHSVVDYIFRWIGIRYSEEFRADNQPKPRRTSMEGQSMSNHLFHWAEEYHQRGYSVIPLQDKVPPAGFLWKEYQSRRAKLDEIAIWFGENSGQHTNVGIVTGGISGLVVVDCDTAEDTRWWLENFPSTPMISTTGRRGAHMYYRRRPAHSVRNRTRVLGRRIDIRGDGGYVVAPPSIHPGTGRAYQWRPWDYFAAEEIPLFDQTWVGPTKRESVTPACPQSRRPSSAIRNPRAYIAHIHAVSGQGGHSSTYRAAATLRDAGMNPDEVLRALVAWNTTNAQPPWSEPELFHKVNDVFKAATK